MAVTFVRRVRIIITDSEIGTKTKKLSEPKQLNPAIVKIRTRVTETQTTRKGWNG